MAFQDSDPERRNLMLTSIAFIAYFYAGGEFKNGIVRLQVINVHFENPEILALIAWLALIWFLYRYWQKHSGAFSSDYESNFKHFHGKTYFIPYVNKKINNIITKDNEEGYHINGIIKRGKTTYLGYRYAHRVTRDKTTNCITGLQNSKEADNSKFNNGEVAVVGIMGKLLLFRATIEYCLRKPAFSSYIVPYLLFFIALIGAYYRMVLTLIRPPAVKGKKVR